MTPVQQVKAAVASPLPVAALSGMAALLSLSTALGYLGPKEQLADMRLEVARAKARVEAVEQELSGIREDVKGIAIFACVQTRNQVVYAQLRCSARFGTTLEPTP